MNRRQTLTYFQSGKTKRGRGGRLAELQAAVQTEKFPDTVFFPKRTSEEHINLKTLYQWWAAGGIEVASVQVVLPGVADVRS